MTERPVPNAIRGIPFPGGRRAIPLLAALVLAACGGGGGDGGGGGGTPAGQTKIHDGNAIDSAAAAYQVTDAFYTAGLSSADAAIELKSGETTGAPAKTVRRSFGGVAIEQLLSVTSAVPGGSPIRGKAVSTDSAACPDGGRIDLRADDADNDGQFSAADSLRITFVDCRIGSERANGSMTMANVDLFDTSTNLRVGARFTFDNLSFTDGSRTESAHGEFALQINYRTSPTHDYEATFAGQRFTVTVNGSPSVLENFSLTSQVDLGANRYAFNFGATVSQPAAGVRTTLATPQVIRGNIGAYPHEGRLRVTEADASALTLTALSATSVRIDIDANGDGVAESTRTTTWSELGG